MAERKDRPAFGEPGADAADPTPIPAEDDEADDFAVEHEDTAVDESITNRRGRGRGESESPHGWSGLEERDHSGN